ncbi:MAG: TusE/DsrC/DsvC family sulfur relay protein [Flavobacteriales bacterium]|nr:TusE/DsrC/DsvC family sulfur relay protein [Flavobacteriales bacterium]MCB9191278.1 TusE/DsrC/DsvC family sulfur relay protein [Flavobacteriales bacterium]MCB9204283.1 TusE/DsrC/DsvC family sulfur relay protein [Flavobacteriales bacterium]
MTTTIAGTEVSVNAEGYMTDLNQWTKEIALEIAAQEGVTMTDKNWEVIAWIQDQYRKEVPLTIRKVGKSGITDIKEFYELFPNGPLKKASKIAGIPKPVSCI